MLLRKEEADFLLKQKVRKKQGKKIFLLLLLENEIIMIYDGTEFLL